MADKRQEGHADWEAELYRLLAENVQDYAIFVVDRQRQIQTWTTGAQRLLGYQSDEIIGQSADILFTPEDIARGAPQRELDLALATGRGTDDRWHVRRDGSWFWASGLLTPLWTPARELRGFAKIMRDRTEWKLADIARQESEARKAAVLEASLDGIITFDQHDRIVEFNPAAESLLGYRRSDTLGRTLSEIIVPPRFHQQYSSGIDYLLAGGREPGLGKRNRRSLLRADGKEFAAELAVVHVPSVQGPLYTCFLRDITVRQSQESRGAVQLGVTEALAEAESIAQAAPRILQDICLNLDWDVAAFWLVDLPSQSLRRLRGWDAAAQSPQELDDDEAQWIFDAGQPLAEQTWRSGKAVLVTDVAAEPGRPELTLAAEAGLHGALAVPLQIGGEVLGVIGTFSRAAPPRDADLLRFLTAIGGHIGQFIQRKHTEEALRASEARFRGLMEQAPFSIQVFAADGRSLQVNHAWEQLWGIPAARSGEYNVLEDPQLVAKGVSDSIRKAFAGEATVIPAIEYDPNETMPDQALGAEARRWVSAVAYPLKDQAGQVREVILVHQDITARQQAEAALRYSEERYRGIVTHSIAGVAEVDLEGRFRFANQRYCEIVGRSLEELLELTMQQISHEDDLKPNLPLFDRLAREGVPYVIEKRYVRPDGSTVWVNNSVSGLGGQDGRVSSIVAVCVDITARRRAEEAHREGEERLRLALEAGRMGTWSWDIASNEVQWSPQLESIHGLVPGTFPGTFEAYQRDMHPDDRQRVIQSIRDAVERGKEHHLEYRLVWPDGSIHWIEARGKLVRDPAGQPKQMIGVCVEISERKRKEEALRFLAEASRSLATLVDHQSTLQQIATLAVPHFADGCAIYLPDESGTLRQLAMAHVESTPVPFARVLSESWACDPRSPEGIHDVFRTRQPVLIDPSANPPRRNGKDLTLQAERLRTLGIESYMCVPMVVRDSTIGVITFIGAQSSRRYTSADLALAEDLANRAAIASENARLYAKIREEGQKKDEFLAMLAHELRNPLAPIRSGLDLLSLMGADRAIVGTMQHQTEHLVRLVDDLLDVSRIMRGKIDLRREPVELAVVVQRATDTVAALVQAHHQQLSVHLPAEPVWLDADPVRLAQVIGNLLNNASKYTPQGGRTELLVEREGDQVLIRVRDNGIGITPQLLPHVFELFTQDQRTIDRAQGGLGIGLTVVKNLVEMHGGTVTAASEGRGRGSEFVVRLPVLTHQQPAVGRQPLRSASAPLRILVVDDNVSAAKMLSLLLQKVGGHEVIAAHDGAAAIAAAQEHHPDLILLDIGLPKLDGFEVTRQLRLQPEFQKTHIAALTGYGTLEDRRKSLSAGFDDHLVKPPAIEELQKILAGVRAARR